MVIMMMVQPMMMKTITTATKNEGESDDYDDDY